MGWKVLVSLFQPCLHPEVWQEAEKKLVIKEKQGPSWSLALKQTQVTSGFIHPKYLLQWANPKEGAGQELGNVLTSTSRDG